MKVKSLLGVVATALASFAGSAQADPCQLYLARTYFNFGQPIYVGESFSYNVDIGYQLFPGPWAPNSYGPFEIAFYGTGITSPNGEQYPFTYPGPGFYNISGFYNPGGFAGTYERYAVLRYAGTLNTYCTTNTISVTLL